MTGNQHLLDYYKRQAYTDVGGFYESLLNAVFRINCLKTQVTNFPNSFSLRQNRPLAGYR